MRRRRADVADALTEAGLTFDESKRAFVSRGVPVHLESRPHVEVDAVRYEEIDGVRVMSLADLMSIKLRSGSENVLRAQDLADVIGLIRARGLDASFASQIHKPLCPAFRKLVKAVKDA